MASTRPQFHGPEVDEAIRKFREGMSGAGMIMKEINPKIVRKEADSSQVRLWKDHDTETIFVRTKCPIGWQTLSDQKGNKVLISSKQEQDAIIRATEIFAKW